MIMTTRIQFLRLVIAAAGVALFTGCRGSVQTTPMLVEVRDRATREPVADAQVRVQPLHLVLPVRDPSATMVFLLGDYLAPPSGESITSTTDERGVAEMRGVTNGPMRVVVLAPGYDMLAVGVQPPRDTMNMSQSWSEWSSEPRSDEPLDEQPAEVEVRVAKPQG